jgi:glucokinase
MSQRPALGEVPSGRYAIGLDVGGTKIAGGVVGSDGRVALHRTVATLPLRGGEPVARDLLALVQELVEEAEGASLTPVAIGLSLCELIDTAGQVVSEQTIKWRNIDIRQRLSRFGPVKIEADCRAAAIGEARFGAGSGLPTFLYVTIGTGISCTLVIEGRPYLGAHGVTGTMATGTVATLCSACGGLSRSVLEEIGSGYAIAQRYRATAGIEVEGAREVAARADAGDGVAVEVIESAAQCVGSTIANLVGVLDPHGVIVGGGLGSAPGLYWETLQASLREHIWSDVHRQLPMLQARLGPRAGVVGAAALALEE